MSNTNKTVWLVTCWRQDVKMIAAVGVFDDQNKAMKACKDSSYMVVPMILNMTADGPV